MVNWYWMPICSMYFLISGILFGTIVGDKRFKEVHKHISSVVLLTIFIILFPIGIPLFNYLGRDENA